MTRRQYTGNVVVYRDNPFSEVLECDIRTGCGKTFYYYRSPSSFEKLALTTQSNSFECTFTANEDGSNPRSVKFVKEIPHRMRRRR